MGRGKKFSEAEIKTIINLRNENLSVGKIARMVKRSKSAIAVLLKDPENYGKRKSTGRPRAVSSRDERAILREASNSTGTAREIAQAAGVNTNIRNVQRILQKSKFIVRKKLKRKPALTQQHIDNRLKFACEHLRWKKRWRKVIFTDEKRFNLDGPDGWNYYFHDLRKDELFKQCRQMGGGGIMIWAGIGYRGKTNIRFVTGKMDSAEYIKILNEELLPNAERIASENYIFQQDNAAVHTAKRVKDYFEGNKINVLQWPARSPDLNIIENVWGQLARMVYGGNKQYETTAALETAILEAWRLIPKKFIRNLYKSLPRRLLEVVKKEGKQTHY